MSLVINRPLLAAGGSPFETPLMHFDAQDVYDGSNPAIDAAVTSWTDLMGNYSLTTVRTGGGVYRSGGPGGQNFVEFSTALAGLSTPTIPVTTFAGATRVTCTGIYVLKYVSDLVWVKWETAPENRYGAEGSNRFDFPNDATAGKLTPWSAVLTANTWKIVEFVVDATTKKVILNGVQVASQATAAPLAAATSAAFNVGTNNIDFFGAICAFCEVLQYNYTVSDASRAAIRAILASKYSITVS